MFECVCLSVVFGCLSVCVCVCVFCARVWEWWIGEQSLLLFNPLACGLSACFAFRTLLTCFTSHCRACFPAPLPKPSLQVSMPSLKRCARMCLCASGTEEQWRGEKHDRSCTHRHTDTQTHTDDSPCFGRCVDMPCSSCQASHS